MPVILIEKDPFVAAFDDLSGSTESSQVNVRRPLFGIAPKPGTFAYLSMVTSKGEKVALYNSSAPGVSGQGRAHENHNFILQSVQYARQERVQIQQTFGDFYTFFFGENPSTVSVSGILCNTTDFNWKNEFLRNYDEYMRGTKCVETRTRVYFGFDDVVVEGYVLSVSVPYQSEAPYLVPFSFNMLVTNYTDLSQTMSSSYVTALEDTRTNSAKTHVEYLTGAAAESDLVDFNRLRGSWGMLDAGKAPGDVLLDASPAVGVSGLNNKEKLYLTPSEAMVKIDVDSQVQQKGVDRTTALLARTKDSSSSFPLSGRSDALASVESSINQKVAFGAAVIKDQPALP
ncbi:MAG: hypothetical protein CMH53_09040 [Myxococcales bacterium]|nr:hypothetical protein [Myxococcales bacterium]